MQVLYIDFETTGLDAGKNAPIEFTAAIVDMDNRTVIDSYSSGKIKVPANAVVDDAALAVNGFSRESLHLGRDRKTVASDFAAFLDRYPSFLPIRPVGHNVPMDVEFLRALMAGTCHFPAYISYRQIDVQSVFAGFLAVNGIAASSSLGAMCRLFNVVNQAPHTSAGDVAAGVAVMFKTLDLVYRECSADDWEDYVTPLMEKPQEPEIQKSEAPDHGTGDVVPASLTAAVKVKKKKGK